MLAVLAYMAVRVDELHQMNVGNIVRDGEHTIIRIKGKGNTTRKGVVPPSAARAVNDWVETADISQDRSGPLFRPTVTARGKGQDGFRMPVGLFRMAAFADISASTRMFRRQKVVAVPYRKGRLDGLYPSATRLKNKETDTFLLSLSSEIAQEDRPKELGRAIADWYRRNLKK